MMTPNLSIIEIQKLLRDKKVTPREVYEYYAGNIKAKDADLNAYREVFDVEADITAAEEAFANGTAKPLTGIPVAIKDNILIKGRIAGASSKMLENYHATYDATAIKLLKDAGAYFIGRTNMDEFAMGGSTENSAYGVTKNPHDLSRVSGGSSGGSAAVVAADMASAALGSDTGGSIRQPSAFCGNVGLKPTFGAVSRHGLIAMGSSLDQIGPIAKTVADTELLFSILRKEDALDGTTFKEGLYIPKQKSGKKPVIGVPYSFMKEGLDADVKANFDATIAKLKAAGYEVKDIELPHISHALAVYYIIMPAAVSSNMARFDGVRYGMHIEGKDVLDEYVKTRGAGFGPEVRRRILLGTYVLSSGYYDAYYGRALQVRAKLKADFDAAFKGVDVIATPTSPTPAFKIGEKTQDPVSMYLADIFTVTANLTGHPALSVPSGSVEKEGKSLPLAIQFTAPYVSEALLFEVGKDVEEARRG